jgi:hypothetical protein
MKILITGERALCVAVSIFTLIALFFVKTSQDESRDLITRQMYNEACQNDSAAWSTIDPTPAYCDHCLEFGIHGCSDTDCIGGYHHEVWHRK